MPNNREEILKFLGDTQSYYAAYHNHKEVTAWAGLVLYVTLLTAFASYVGDSLTDSPELTVFTIVVVAAMGFSFFIFLRVQFSMRSDAARLIAACIYLQSKYLSEPDTEIEIKRFAPLHNNNGPESDRCIPEIILAEKQRIGSDSLRKTLEYCIYAVVLLITGLAITRIWSIYFG